MNFLKRFFAIFVALVLFLQLAACSPTQPSYSINSQSQTASQEEVSSDNTTSSSENDDSSLENTNSDNKQSSINQSSNNTNQNTDKEEINSSNDDSSDNHQNSSTTSSDIVDSDKEEENQQDIKDDGKDDYVDIICNHTSSYSDPYQGVSKTDFYFNYKTACCNLDAKHRSKHGFLSGALDVPGQYAVEANERPKSNDKFIRNTSAIYLDDGNTYLVLDANGKEVMRIHKAGGYITLEEVAAYMYAFGGNEQIPANYISKKKGNPSTNIWGEYLRVNHSYFKGDTDRYPYEPELPNISGCGGNLRYYEMDIGTTGTVTPGYAAKPYIQGNKINRGAARIVYVRQDLNGNGEYESNEVYVFYTHNHYNDFREYLNYYGGWGEMFGNITGGGEYSSEYNANPTPYIPTDYDDFSQ